MNDLRKRRGNHLRLLTGRRDLAPADAGPNDLSAPHEAGNVTGATRVLIAADHALVRAGYRALLESDDRIEVVAEAGDCHTAILLAGEAWWNRDSRARIAPALEREHTAAMARTLDPIDRLPETADPSANI